MILYSIYLDLLRYRLHWYKSIMQSVLLRHKHGIIILVTLLAPTFIGLMTFLSQPILFIAKSNHHALQSFYSLFALQMVYVVWAHVQKKAIRPNIINAYFSSLPLSNTLLRWIDLNILIIANNFMWIPFIFAIIVLFLSHTVTALIILRILLIILSILSFQINILNFCLLQIGLALSADFVFASGVAVENIAFQTLLFSMLLIISSLVRTKVNLFKIMKMRFKDTKNSSKITFSNKNSFFILLVCLYKQNKAAFIARIIVCVSIIILSIAMLVLSNQYNNMKIISLVSLGFCTFSVAGFSSNLVKERSKYVLYLDSLPSPKYFWQINDMAVLGIILLGINIIYFSVAFMLRLTMHLSICLEILAIELVLLTPLYFLHGKFQRFGTLFSFVVFSMWLIVVVKYLA